MNKWNFLGWLIMLAALNGYAQSRDSLVVRSIVNEVMRNGHAYDQLRVLCQHGPRLSGSEGAAKAVDMTADMLRSSKADAVWLQPCYVPKWVRGPVEQGYVSRPGATPYMLRLTSLGDAVGTGGREICADLVMLTDMGQAVKLGNKGLKGKIAFFNLPMDPAHIRTFKAYGESGVARRNGPSLAAKYGASAVIVRSLASNIDGYPHTGATKYNDSFPKIPAVAVSTEDAEWLSREISVGGKLEACINTSAMMMGEVLSYNVVAEIRGSEYPDEIITVGGHLDSWDLGEGAHDDGAGCVQAIEMIRTFKALGIRPKRTIRAVLFMNEENGGRGAKAYLDSAKARGEKHLFALESDAGGFSPRGFSFDCSDQAFKRIQSWKGILAEYGAGEFTRGGSGSDISPLKSVGTELAGLVPDSQRYFDLHHAATDVFSTVNKRELHLGAAVMTALAWLVSEYGF